MASMVVTGTTLAQAAPSDPTGGWLTFFSSLGVAGLLVAYMGFDNNRLRKESAAKDVVIQAKEEERAKLLADMLSRYERLIPVETKSQEIHTESIKVLERAMTMMHQLASRPTLSPDVLSLIEDRYRREQRGSIGGGT
jgi:hypothetical protein